MASAYTVGRDAQIRVPDGNVLLSSINEGTQVIGSLSVHTPCFVTQKPRRKQATNSVRLFGINGDTPTFRLGQVFHTTTGLRAVSPREAGCDRLTCAIGPLGPGHVLLKLDEQGTTYKPYVIEQLDFEDIITDLFSLPLLAEKTDNLHIEDFLVHRPCILSDLGATVNKLKSMPETARLDCLQSVDGLQSLFHNLGAATVKEVLERELDGDAWIDLPLNTSTGGSHFINVRQLRRSYNLKAGDHVKLPEDYTIPMVTLYEGLLQIDGQWVPRCMIDDASGCLRWTRPLANGLFEHGRIDLFTHCLAGQGVFLITSDPNQMNVLSSGPHHVIPFRATVLPQMLSKLQRKASHQLLNSQADIYDITLDLDSWAKGTDKQTPTNPAPFGHITLATYDTSGDTGFAVPMIQIKLLDDLRDAINNAFQGQGGPPIDSLYTSTMAFDKQPSDVQQIANVTFDKAAFVLNLADPGPQGSVRNLTFKTQLKSDIVLPILFQQLQFQIDDTSITGSLFEFNTIYRGNIGDRHLVCSAASTDNVARDLRAQYSARCGLLIPVGHQRPSGPSQVTERLRDLADMNLENLVEVPGYSDIKIHNMTQSMVQTMMLYHMDPGHRGTLLQQPQPVTNVDIPPALADDLDQNGSGLKLSAWLRDVYAPAYISKLLCSVPPSQSKQWSHGFSPDQVAQLEYWWNGKGKSCLSQSKEHQAIVSLACNQSLLTLNPRLKSYQNDGDIWAAHLLKDLADPACVRALVATPMHSGTSFANKYASIVRLLNSKADVSSLFRSTFGHVVSQAALAPYIDTQAGASDDAAAYLNDSFRLVAKQALEPSSQSLTMETAMQQDFEADIVAAEKALGLPGTGDADTRITALLAKKDLSDLIALLSQSLAQTSQSTETGINVDADFDWKSTGLSMFSWLSAQYTWASNKLFPPNSPMPVAMKGILALGLAAFFIYKAVSGFSTFDAKDLAEKSTLVFTTIQGLIQQIWRGFTYWKTWKNFAVTTANDRYIVLKLAMALNSDVEMDNLGPVIDVMNTEFTGIIGPNPIEVSVAERMYGEGTPRQFKLQDDFAILKGDYEDTQKALLRAADMCDLAGEFLSVAFVIISVGVIVSMTFVLIEQFDSLDTKTKVMDFIQLGVTALSVVCNELFVQACILAGFMTAEATMASTLPAIGIVLAIIGVVVFVVAYFILKHNASTPPPQSDPTGTFISTKAYPLLASWVAQPEYTLSYDIEDQVVLNTNDPTKYVVSASNSNAFVTRLTSLTVTFSAGTASSSTDKSSLTLFNTPTIYDLVPASGLNLTKPGSIYLLGSAADSCTATVSRDPLSDTTDSFSVTITGVATDSGGENPTGLIQMNPHQTLSVTVVGMIQDAGITQVRVVEQLMPVEGGQGPKDSTYRVVLVGKGQ